MKQKWFCLLVSVLAIGLWVSLADAGTFSFTTIDDPLAGAGGTQVNGISGSTIVGRYYDSSDTDNGFTYDGSTFTTVDHPAGVYGTKLYGVSGNIAVGYYFDASYDFQSFLYDGSAYTPFTPPGAISTRVFGISGNNIVGDFSTPNNFHNFLYDGATYTYLNDPLAKYGTIGFGVSDSKVVGYYVDSTSQYRGFVYDIANRTYSPLDDPLAGTWGTQPTGISGNDIVGYYVDSSGGGHGFLYDGLDYTTFDIPGAASTTLTGISGNNIVGYYVDPGTGTSHGFIASIPEPSTFALLSVGAIAFIGYRCRWRNWTKRNCLGVSAILFPLGLLTSPASAQTFTTIDDPSAVNGSFAAGMQAALDLANTGFYVYLVEKSSAVGGMMSELDKTPPQTTARCELFRPSWSRSAAP